MVPRISINGAMMEKYISQYCSTSVCPLSINMRTIYLPQKCRTTVITSAYTADIPVETLAPFLIRSNLPAPIFCEE